MKFGELLESFRKLKTSRAEEDKIIGRWVDSHDSELSEFKSLPESEKQRRLNVLYERILHTNRRSDRRAMRIERIRAIVSVAAVVTVLLSGIFIFRYRTDTNVSYQQQANQARKGAVILVLDNTQVDLAEKEKGIEIRDGEISYASGKTLASQSFNAKLITPKGKTYKLELPDGTQVVLNAMSSIEFPTKFSENGARVVVLNGEGYFEVSKIRRSDVKAGQHQPFVVKTNDQIIEVLGTHFNVRAYADDKESRTTLIEGEVRASGGGQKQVLRPGDEFVSDVHGASLRKADIEEALSWLSGRIIFDDEPLERIMRRIARWYDMEVIYKGAERGRLYGGSISVNEDLRAALRHLELTGGVHFRIEGRRIYVTD